MRVYATSPGPAAFLAGGGYALLPNMRSCSHLVALLLLASSPSVLAQADAQTASLARTLKEGTAPPRRLQAARVLGTLEDPEAVAPLCGALADESAEVRAAAAGALEQLAEPDAVGCLEARKDEADPAARAALDSALKKLKALQARPARMYVMLAPLKDATGSLSPELLKLTEARLRRALFQAGAALAPEKETEAQARAELLKRKLPGFRLVPEVRPGAAGGLKLSSLCMRYPGKQLMGTVNVQAGDAEPGELLKALAPGLVEEAVKTFDWKPTK